MVARGAAESPGRCGESLCCWPSNIQVSNCFCCAGPCPELRNNHILPLRAELDGYAKYNQDERAFLFPNGSRLALGYCDNEGDMLQYQGQEYDVIGFEEATNFQEEWILFISTCLRTTRTDFSPRIYYTMNPGGVGHSYIKRIFIDRQYREGERPEDFVFIRQRFTTTRC